MEGGTRAGLSVEEHFEELVKELTVRLDVSIFPHQHQ
jgi:hypothetical protein